MTRGISSLTRPFSSAAMQICAFLILAAIGASSQQLGTNLASLPSDAQGRISAALGRDDSSYWIHRSAKGLRGENSRQALAADFTRAGAEVRSQNLSWTLQTLGYGYGDVLPRLKTVAPQAIDNRVEYRRDGMTEWYENGPSGLEQGFTLACPPGKANGQALTVELALMGDLAASVAPGAKSLQLTGKNGKAVFRYTGLQARDATGRELRSWLEMRGARLLVRVEDKGARYPVVVDPWIQQAQLSASDAASVEFGSSVAMDGSEALVGAPCHTESGSGCGPGAAYVFVESGGTWSQRAELTASDGASDDFFGGSVAISGNTAVVLNRLGRAYVFVNSGGTWTQLQELTAPDDAPDGFGAVAIDGSTMVLGVPGQTVGSNPSQGAAYIFVESGGTWSQQAELTASDGAQYDTFGVSVGVSRGTVVVGAWGHSVGFNIYQGAAYVFVQSGTTWNQQAELTASDGAAGDSFGASVAVSGSTAVVGAVEHSVGLNKGQGAAYVFVQSGTDWNQQAELTAADGAAGDVLGYSVAVSGSTVAAGDAYHAVGLNQQKGAVYTFVQNGTTWNQESEITVPNGRLFGYSAAIQGSNILAGDPFDDTGFAYVFGSSGPLYTLSAAPNSLILQQAGQVTSTITITPWNGFSGSVSFLALGVPFNVTAAFDPDPATSASTLTLTASPLASAGTATITVLGTSGSLTQNTMLTLTVTLAPGAVVKPALLNFGNDIINNSAVRYVTITNNGQATLYIGKMVASSNFAVASTTCGAELAVRRSCKVKVTFTPTEPGPITGTLSITDNAPNSPQMVTLAGTGIEPATLTPAKASYAKQLVGTTSAAKTFTLRNNQAVALTNIAISTTGDFSVSATTCGTSLAAQAKCTINVTFTPTGTGTRSGQLIVGDSAANNPQTSNLSGTGK
jgi:hypothetical protein